MTDKGAPVKDGGAFSFWGTPLSDTIILVTPDVLVEMCASTFPGVQITVSESPGATRCEFWVWQFEVSFTLTTKAMSFVDKVGQVGFTFRFKHTPTSTPHPIRQEHVDGVVAVQGLLEWVVQYVQGIACAIELAQTPPPEPPAFSF